MNEQATKDSDVERICQKHFPQLRFYPELLPIIQESWDAGKDFAVTERENMLRNLASALKKFAPEAVEIILKKVREEQQGYEDFVAFLRSQS